MYIRLYFFFRFAKVRHKVPLIELMPLVFGLCTSRTTCLMVPSDNGNPSERNSRYVLGRRSQMSTDASVWRIHCEVVDIYSDYSLHYHFGLFALCGPLCTVQTDDNNVTLLRSVESIKAINNGKLTRSSSSVRWDLYSLCTLHNALFTGKNVLRNRTVLWFTIAIDDEATYSDHIRGH